MKKLQIIWLLLNTVVNWWCGAWWFGILGVPLSNNPFHTGIPHHRARNHQLITGCKLSGFWNIQKKTSYLEHPHKKTWRFWVHIFPCSKIQAWPFVYIGGWCHRAPSKSCPSTRRGILVFKEAGETRRWLLFPLAIVAMLWASPLLLDTWM